MAPRPILQLALVNGQNRLSCYAIVDSGADCCAFPSSFLLPLGINPFGMPFEPTNGVGGLTLSFFYNIQIDLQGIVQFPAYTAFTDGLNQWGVGLLGQSGFFDRVGVHFDLHNGKFEIDI
jgi:hypothetical protein